MKKEHLILLLVPVLFLSLCTVSMAAREKKGAEVSNKAAVSEKKEGRADAGDGKELSGEKSESGEKGGIAGVTEREYDEKDFAPKPTGDSYAWDIIKAILILGIMVGAFYYFFKFITKKTGLQVHGEGIVKTLAVVPVAQNKYIQVVDLAGRILVLGIADSGINLITEVTDRDEIDRIRLASSHSKSVPEGGFQEYIRQQVGKVVDKINEKKGGGHGNMLHEDGGVDLDYLKMQKSRLKNLDRYGDE